MPGIRVNFESRGLQYPKPKTKWFLCKPPKSYDADQATMLVEYCNGPYVKFE